MDIGGLLMKGQTENRRVRMTRRLMKDALLELLEHTELSNISVTAICEAADVNRSTFYNYYTCPLDLLQEIEQDVLDQIPTSPQILDHKGEKQLLHSTTAFFDYVKKMKRYFASFSANRLIMIFPLAWLICSVPSIFPVSKVWMSHPHGLYSATLPMELLGCCGTG